MGRSALSTQENLPTLGTKNRSRGEDCRYEQIGPIDGVYEVDRDMIGCRYLIRHPTMSPQKGQT